jgi:hypothetical protein
MSRTIQPTELLTNRIEASRELITGACLPAAVATGASASTYVLLDLLNAKARGLDIHCDTLMSAEVTEKLVVIYERWPCVFTEACCCYALYAAPNTAVPTGSPTSRPACSKPSSDYVQILRSNIRQPVVRACISAH